MNAAVTITPPTGATAANGEIHSSSSTAVRSRSDSLPKPTHPVPMSSIHHLPNTNTNTNTLSTAVATGVVDRGEMNGIGHSTDPLMDELIIKYAMNDDEINNIGSHV